MKNEGYIKLSRGLTGHWIWQDHERLKWWIDMLYMAAWKNCETYHDSHKFTLERGQFIASIKYLTERWQRNKSMVIRFLKTLEEEGMITRKVAYRQTPIITICNYDIYQGNATTDADTQTDMQTETPTETQTDAQTVTNKRNKENKEIYIADDMRMSNFYDDFFSDCNTTKIEQLAMSMRTDVSVLKKLGREIENEWFLTGQSHRDYTEMSRHFISTLRIKVQNKNKQKHHGTDKSFHNNNTRRGDTEGCSASAADYKTAF